MNKFVLAHLVVVTVSSIARADGLLYQLPDDGVSVQFAMTISSDQENRSETVIMRSVGRVGDARWLEFRLPMEDSTKTIKVLFPERVLKEGESPMDHVVRAWRRSGDDDAPQSLTRVRDFWLLIFLAGPLSDIKTLESEEIDSPLGKLKCDGLTGRAHVREDDGFEEELTYRIRRHKDAPFGVVSCRIDCQVSRDGKKLDRVTYELRLTGVDRNAQSDLREYQ